MASYREQIGARMKYRMSFAFSSSTGCEVVLQFETSATSYHHAITRIKQYLLQERPTLKFLDSAPNPEAAPEIVDLDAWYRDQAA